MVFMVRNGGMVFVFYNPTCVTKNYLIIIEDFQTLNFFLDGVVTEQQSEMFHPLCEKPPSVIQWLYNFLNGHLVREK